MFWRTISFATQMVIKTQNLRRRNTHIIRNTFSLIYVFVTLYIFCEVMQWLTWYVHVSTTSPDYERIDLTGIGKNSMAHNVTIFLDWLEKGQHLHLSRFLADEIFSTREDWDLFVEYTNIGCLVQAQYWLKIRKNMDSSQQIQDVDPMLV